MDDRIMQAAVRAYEYASSDDLDVSYHGLRAAVSRALDMQREEIAAAIEAEDKGRTICACGHGAALHPSGGCIHGMTWTKPATCPCRSYEPQPVSTEITIDRAARIAREHGTD